MKKNILIIFALMVLFAPAFADVTVGRIYHPTGGETVGKTFTADFNLSDDYNISYNTKSVLFWISVQDTNVFSDYNMSINFGTTCAASGAADVNTGQIRCKVSISTLNLAEGSATMTIHGYNDVNKTVDTNVSATFTIEKGYNISTDADINKYSRADIQDLGESGIGTAVRSFILVIGLIILVVVVAYGIYSLNKARKKAS